MFVIPGGRLGDRHCHRHEPNYKKRRVKKRVEIF